MKFKIYVFLLVIISMFITGCNLNKNNIIDKQKNTGNINNKLDSKKDLGEDNKLGQDKKEENNTEIDLGQYLNTGNINMKSIKQIAEKGDTVEVDYTLYVDNKVVDTSVEKIAKENNIFNPNRAYKPLIFTIGSGQVIPGFEKAVLGMKIGEKKKIEVLPQEGYGEYNPELLFNLPLSKFKQAGIKPKIGMKLNLGNGIIGVIKSISGDSVKIDANPPLAGKKLVFEIILRGIKK